MAKVPSCPLLTAARVRQDLAFPPWEDVEVLQSITVLSPVAAQLGWGLRLCQGSGVNSQRDWGSQGQAWGMVRGSCTLHPWVLSGTALHHLHPDQRQAHPLGRGRAQCSSMTALHPQSPCSPQNPREDTSPAWHMLPPAAGCAGHWCRVYCFPLIPRLSSTAIQHTSTRTHQPPHPIPLPHCTPRLLTPPLPAPQTPASPSATYREGEKNILMIIRTS